MVQTFPHPIAIGYSAISSSVSGFIAFNPLFIAAVEASTPLHEPSVLDTTAERPPSVKPAAQKQTVIAKPTMHRDLTGQGEVAHPFKGKSTIPLDVNTLTDLPE